MMLSSLFRSLNPISKATQLVISAERALSISQVRLRKPRHLGRAPSKEGIYFKKPRPTAHDVMRGELAYKAYNEMLRSIAAAFQEELLSKGADVKRKSNDFDEEAHHAKCMAFNDEHNAKMRTERENRLATIIQQQENDLKQRELLTQQNLEKKLKKFDDEVADALEEHKNWITLENMEDKINEALNNVVNYNFSVDKTGKIIRRTLTP